MILIYNYFHTVYHFAKSFRKERKKITHVIKTNWTHFKASVDSREIDRLVPLGLVISLFFPFYISVAAVSAVAVMTMISYQKRSRALESPYCKFLLGFLVVPFFVSAVYNNYLGMLYAILLLASVICAFYLKSVMTRQVFHQMMDLACLSSLGCAGIAFYQKWSAYPTAADYRPVSNFSNANYYGMMIEFVVLIALYRIFTNPKRKTLYMTVIGINLASLYLTASMSACLGIFCAVMIFLWMKKQYFWMAAFLTAAVSFLLLSFAFPAAFPRIEAIDSTFGQRLSVWVGSIRGIQQHPLLGQGATAYQMICGIFGTYPTFHSHNLLLDVLLNYGLIGAGAMGFYIYMQGKLVALRMKNHICNNMNILLISAFTAVLVHGLTDVTVFWIQTGMLFLMIFSSTGIHASYLEWKLRLPQAALLPHYPPELGMQPIYIKNERAI